MSKRLFAQCLLAILLIAWAPTAVMLGHASTRVRDFFYAGGTESMRTGCGGKLELTEVAMTFRCPEGSITIPYDSITLMEYRPKLSSRVRKMKLSWKVKPSSATRNRNSLFTVLYMQGDSTHAVVFRVLPDEMRPYLAEIELNTGKRIQVWDYRGFD